MPEINEGSGWYWIKQHSKEKLLNFASEHKIAFTLGAIFLLFMVFALRALYHPVIMVLRENIFLVALAIIFYVLVQLELEDLTPKRKILLMAPVVAIFGISICEAILANIPIMLIVMEHAFLGLTIVVMVAGLRTWKKCEKFERKISTFFARVAMVALILLFITGCWYYDANPHKYLALYYRYKTLDIVELQRDPTTENERIQPLAAIHAIGKAKTFEAEFLSEPDFVRDGEEYRFTLAIAPKYFYTRIFGHVRQIFNVLGTIPSPDFSSTEKVNFDVGENLLLGSNSLAATCKTFGPMKYFNYRPVEVRYIKDDAGKWVQIVSMIRWKGIIFPYPEFGGVQVIRQVEKSESGADRLFSVAKRFLLGTGVWIHPEDISKHEYLTGQNIVPYQMSRYIANSFRFQKGFTAPLPGYHNGDIRIPYIPEDRNEQPITSYWEMDGQAKNELYHHFMMEPYAEDKKGLSTTIFVPADGIDCKIYCIRHSEKEERLTGPSGIKATIESSSKDSMKISWKTEGRGIECIERRPWWKKIGKDGKVMKFLLTTVTASTDKQDGTEGTGNKETQKLESIAANLRPQSVLVCLEPLVAIWVDDSDPKTWVDQVKKELSLE